MNAELCEALDKVPREMLGNRRVTGKEQFYTPLDTAKDVCGLVIERVPDALSRLWLEPAGGTGAFIEAAKSFGVSEVVSFDIEPHHPSVQKGDFLQQNLQLSGVIAVSNPPFGRNNALSVPFFNKCGQMCDYITFIVPRSWRKWSVINRLHKNFHLIEDRDLSISYVDVDGVDNYTNNNLRTCVQVWERREPLREKIAVPDFGLVRRVSPQEADIALTIFGYGCGTVKTDFERRKITTQMYLKMEHPQALDALREVDFSRFYNSVAYTEALSIQEINYLLNEYVFGSPNGDKASLGAIDDAPR